MLTRVTVTRLALVVGLGLTLVGCAQFQNLKARKLFKEANAHYQGQRYKAAADAYEEVLHADPNMVDAYFYLGNSYDNLYKPSRQGEAENDSYLTKSIENYKKAAEQHPDSKMKKLALEYLVASYGPDKLNDPAQAEPIVQRMIELDPSEAANYFVLSKIYEDNGNYDDAEATLLKAREARPNDPAVFLNIAGFYNRQGDFPKTIEALEQRTAREPNNPEAYYTTATYFWEKAYRDFRITEKEKADYVQKGLDQVDRAIQIKPDYSEAMVYKNILLRMKANMEKDPGRQSALIKEADVLRDKANELRKAGEAARAAAPGGKPAQ
jgi:tetratricopeptide (TPR) repeat protein